MGKGSAAGLEKYLVVYCFIFIASAMCHLSSIKTFSITAQYSKSHLHFESIFSILSLLIMEWQLILEIIKGSIHGSALLYNIEHQSVPSKQPSWSRHGLKKTHNTILKRSPDTVANI